MAETETEIRFLDIDLPKLYKKLTLLKAQDLGKDLLQELIFYDKDLTWQYQQKKQVRIRKTKKGIFLAFKHAANLGSATSTEIEFKIEDLEKAKHFLIELGLVLFRTQERNRHSFKLKNVTIDIDFYPKVPPLVELEGESKSDLKNAASLLDLDWSKAVLEPTRFALEKRYNLKVSKLKFFTFKKIT